ncbi:MAG: CHC2 zinc finger domain-containing protein [Actinomycetota bacterium]|nr:CHC2 zinc finger domain-containing protein [Actinomycetota bacterium]
MTTNTTAPTSSGGAPEGVYENPRPYGEKRLSDVIKEQIAVETLADDLGAELRRAGKGLRGLCPIHGGSNREAFAVFPEQGRWHCFVCNEGGDVIDLWMRAKGYFDFKAALIDLAGLYGVQAPPRSPRWHGWQTEKCRRYDELRRWRERRYHRRYYRMFAADGIAQIEDDAEREREAQTTWDELGGLARAWAIRSLEETG